MSDSLLLHARRHQGKPPRTPAGRTAAVLVDTKTAVSGVSTAAVSITTVSLNVDDQLVIKRARESDDGNGVWASPTATGLTTTRRAFVLTSTSIRSHVDLWTSTPVTTPGAVTVSSGALTGGSGNAKSMTVEVWRGATVFDGTQQVVQLNGGASGLPDTHLLSSRFDNDELSWVAADFAAVAPGTPTYFEGAVEELLHNVSGTSYVAYHGRQDATLAGGHRVGLRTGAAGMTWTLVGINVQSLAASAGTDFPLTGTTPATADTSGTATARLVLVGAVAAVTAVAGAIGVSQGLSGSVAATSATAGSVTAQHPLGGTAAATTTTVGSPAADHPLGASAGSTTSLAGSLSSRQALGGTVSGTSTTSGTLSLRAPLAGTVTGTTATTGTPTSRQALTGAVIGTTATSGSFFEAGPQTYPLAGTITAATTTAGSFTARHPLAGQATASTASTGTVTLRVTLTGSTPVLTTVTGEATADHTLEGVTESVVTTVGTLTVTGPPSTFDGRILTARLSVLAVTGRLTHPHASGHLSTPGISAVLDTHGTTARLSVPQATGVLG